MFSQQGEDIYILKHFINKRVNEGVYVELGATDGITYSNTKYFHDKFGFRGILIEPQPGMFKNLVLNRPYDILINKAISTSIDPVKFLGDNPTGGIEHSMTESFKNIWHKNSNSYYTETDTLERIFGENDIKYIDLFSLDVEGGELEVLKTINFGDVSIYVICIELDGHNPEKDEECRTILRNNGFSFSRRLFINEFWVNENYFRRNELFDSSIPFYFSGIDESNKTSNLGKHYFVEPHLISEINKILSS